MYVQPLEGSLASPLSSLSGNSQQGTLSAGGALTAPGDNISRFVPPWPGNGSAADAYGEPPYGSSPMQGLFGPLMGMLSQLMQMLQSLMGYGGSTSPFGSNGGCPPNGNGSCAPYGNEQFFQNATGGSQGDPHLSFNGMSRTLVAWQERAPSKSELSPEAKPPERTSDDQSHFTSTLTQRRKGR